MKRRGALSFIAGAWMLAVLGVDAAALSDEMGPARVSASFTTEGGPEVVASDPRLAGTWTEETGPSTAVMLGGETVVWWDPLRIDNAEGSWVGHVEGYTGESLPTDETVFLVGEGAYEGLSATLFSPVGEDREPGTVEGQGYEGVIFPFGWLPVSEPASP